MLIKDVELELSERAHIISISTEDFYKLAYVYKHRQ